MNYDDISQRNSSYTIKTFEGLVFLPLTRIKYTLRNQWFDDIKRMFQQVIHFWSIKYFNFFDVIRHLISTAS